ncbi:hypothetical protein CB0940_12130 [Cercospora beticola]|uniref:Uncharacterized protein n=1 Tax=Cercospora beticola TaxID=122368 RepID=A0A2G5GJ00_CERBT|nr:hypothetical protein CB0940_12130 [Cercospora beticola]PIA80042.1 hypothetical protein CB0940_12130 [Cercospora beticola]WPB07627.1 hypothetical protein RHO25_012288 [Cercospora beticola]CAK1356572.1 unnamed protein product [Cercospora beticola]
MVRTRHSLAAPDEDDLELGLENGEKPKWMKELQIDGKETLKGEKKADRGMGVYTWRGAVYAIDENTPKEWIEAEANRQRRSEKKEKERQKSQTPVTNTANVPRFSNLKPKVQQQQQDSMTMQLEEQSETQARTSNTKKRAREEGSAAEEATRVIKKPRKALNSLKDKPAQPQRHYLFPSLNAQPKKKKMKPKSDTPRFESSVSASQKTREEVEQSRKEAKGRGFDVDMLSESGLSLPPNTNPPSEVQTTMPTPPSQILEMPKSFTMPFSDQDKQTLGRIVCNITEPEANQLAATIVEIGKINQRAQALQHDSEGLLEHMTRVKERMLARRVGGSLEKQDRHHHHHDSPMMGAAQEMTPPAEDPPTHTAATTANSIRLPSLFHDDAPSEHTLSSPAPHHDLYSLILPPINRGGQQQRWSLDSEKLHQHQQQQQQQSLPSLTQHRHDDDRAESLIYRGRFEGESQSARRRRIDREVKILESLPRLLDRMPDASAGAKKAAAPGKGGLGF